MSEEKESYDCIVLGGGPGGYVASIRLGQEGMRVLCIEERKILGGTCLNVGCIPSKVLLDISQKYTEASSNFGKLGLETEISCNLEKVMLRKEKVIAGLGAGIDFLFKKNKVERLYGKGRLISSTEVEVEGEGGKRVVVSGERIILASGSESTSLASVKVDEKDIVTSTGALSFSAIPEKLVVVGGGVIGLELGSVWSRLGTKVVVLEYLDRIALGFDSSFSSDLEKLLSRQGLVIKKSVSVEKVSRKKGGGLEVHYRSLGDADGKTLETESCDKVLMATGRRARVSGVEVGVELDERGFIKVGSNYQTNINNIYAIGDCIGGKMLAHKAEEEALACVRHILGEEMEVHYGQIPSVIYTHPEGASIGEDEDSAAEKGLDIVVGKFSFKGNSRAQIIGETSGYVKIIAEKSSDKILGGSILGPQAGELIEEIAIVMSYGGSSEDLSLVSHGHPGLAEAIKECALATHYKPIHG